VLKAGKHVHLDKPGGFDHKAFSAMRLEAERRNLTLQI
jgi:predicted dehydrogenase